MHLVGMHLDIISFWLLLLLVLWLGQPLVEIKHLMALIKWIIACEICFLKLLSEADVLNAV